MSQRVSAENGRVTVAALRACCHATLPCLTPTPPPHPIASSARAALQGDTAPPALSNENLLINELIREYLEFNNYHQTLSVFLPETGQPVARPFERDVLASELQVAEKPSRDAAAAPVPLLYSFLRPQGDVDDRS